MSDYSNMKYNLSPYDFKVLQENLMREQEIATTSMHMLREKLAHCVRTENVNQFVNCRELREQYLALCQDKYKGMKFPEGLEPVNRNVPGLVTRERKQ